MKQETKIGITAPIQLIKDVAKAHGILASSQSTYRLKVAAKNYLRLQELPGIPIKDARFYRQAFVEDDGEFLEQVKLDWGRQNLEAVKALEHAKLQAAIDSGECVRSAMDYWYKKSELLNRLQFADLYDIAYTREDPKLQEVYQRCVDYREEIRLYFNLEVSPNETSVRTVNKLLRKLHGFDVKQIGTIGPNGKQLRVYQVSDHRSQTRDEIVQALNLKSLDYICGKKIIDPNDQYSLDYPPDKSLDIGAIQSSNPNNLIEKGSNIAFSGDKPS